MGYHNITGSPTVFPRPIKSLHEISPLIVPPLARLHPNFAACSLMPRPSLSRFARAEWCMKLNNPQVETLRGARATVCLAAQVKRPWRGLAVLRKEAHPVALRYTVLVPEYVDGRCFVW